MALDAEEFDFEGLGSKLTSTILGSFDDALGKIKFSTIGTSLTSALKEVKMSKIIEDSLTKSSEVKAAMKDIQKKLEDGFNKIKFKVGDIVIPDLPEQVVKVTADTSAFKLPKQKAIEVTINYKPNKFQAPKGDAITVPVKYDYGSINPPKADDIVAKVKYDYGKFDPPQPKAIEVPVKYKADEFTLPKVKTLQAHVKFVYDKSVPPEPDPIKVLVKYVYSKFIPPKIDDITVGVKYNTESLELPKPKALEVPVSYLYSKFNLPKASKLDVPVEYTYEKLTLPKVEALKVGVQFVYDKFILPTAQKVSVAVEYVYEKFTQPKPKELPVTLVPDTTKLDLVKPTVDTGPFEKVGDLVREFVNLTQEANKKTKITSELYTKIVSIAEKLVATKRMEKGAMDQLLASYGQKMDIPTAEITAEVVDVDTSKVAEASIAPIEIEAKVGKVGSGDFTSIEKAMTMLIGKLGKQLQSLFKTFDNKKLNIAIPPTDRLDDYRVSYDTISSAVEELKSEVGELSNLELFLSVYSKDTYDIVQKRIAVENLLVGKKREELDVAAKVIGLTNTASLSESQLKALIESKLVSLHKEVELRGLIVNATESYNSTIQQTDLGKLTAELTSQLGLIEDEVAAKATVLALENERVTGVRALTAEQIILLKSEDGILNKKKEILNADQALLNLNKTIVESNKKIDLTIQTQQLANQLSLLSEEAKLKAELLLQQKLVNGEVAELTNSEKLSIVFLDQQVSSSKKFADALAKVGQGQTEINNLVEDLGYDKVITELAIQKGLTESTIVAQAKSLIAAKVAAGEAAKLTDEEMSQLQVLNDQIKSDQEILGLKQRIVEATNSLSKTMQDATAEALALESPMYTQLSLTQDLTREKALSIILDGQRRGLTTDEINMQLQLLKNEDGILQKTRERVNASKDLEAAADAYAQAVRQADADIQIKSLIVALHLTEDEVAQEARLLALKNQQAAAAGNLTKEELAQIQANNGLTSAQVQQLKLNNQTLRHRREEVELVEHVANYQKEVNEELEKYSMGWKKTKATIKAIFNDPAFAKAAFLVSAKEGIHALTHSMHEFKDIGMDAGTAIAATFKSFSLASFVGLSKSDEVVKSIASEFGNLNALTDAQVNAVGKMAAANGLAGEEATNLVMSMGRMPGMTRESAANSEQMFKDIGKAKGVIPAQIMKEVAKNTQFMAIYSKGGAKGFAEAAAHAKKMGVNLGDMLSAARKTLDFESSLNAQMEASVMLGKEINLDKLRQATLSGDANAILREQQNLIRQAGGLDKMNVLQKEKLAEAMGMTVEQMQKMNDEAQFQNKYFGEQADLTDRIVGNVLKYGEAFTTGFGKVAPLLTGIASLMSIMNATSLPGMVKGVWNMVKGLSAGLLQAGLLLLKFIAIGITKLFSADTWRSMASGISGAAGALKNFSFKGAVEGITDMGKKMKDFIKDASSGKVKDAFSGLMGKVKKPELPAGGDKVAEIGDKASQASNKTKSVQSGKGVKDFLTNLAAGLKAMGDGKVLFGAINLIPASIGLVAMIPGVLGAKLIEKIDGKKLKESLTNLAKGIASFGEGKVIGGAIAMVIAAPALLVMGLASLPARLIENIDGKKLKKSLEGVAEGVSAFGSGKVLLGSVAMIIATPGLIAISLASIPLSIVGALGPMISKGLQSLASGIESFGSGKVLKGALGLAVVGLSLIPAALAFQMLKGIDPGTIAAFSLSIIGLATAAAILGNFMAQMIMGAVGIAILGAALLPMALVFQMIAGIDTKSIVAFGLAIVGFSLAAAGLSFIAPLIIVGAGAIAILGLAMLPFAAALALAAPATEIMAKVLKDLSGDITSKNLKTLSTSLFGLAKALGAVGIAGMLALPALGVVAGLSALGSVGVGGGAAAPVKPATPATAAPTAKAETKPIAPAPAAALSTPAPTPAPAPAATAPVATKTESSGDMKALLAKLDGLIAVLQAGGTITMDGQKVANIVQRNIRAVRFSD